MESRKARRAYWVVALLIACAVIYFAVSMSGPKAPPQMQMPPAEVVVQKVTPADIPLTFEYSGRVAGSREVEVRARVSGILLERKYVEGSAVKEGDVLFRIDPEPTKAALAEIQARLRQAESDWKRVTELYKEKAVSAREYEQARAAYESAQAETKAASLNYGYTTVTAPISGITSREGLSEGSLITANTSLLTRISQLDPIYVNFAAADAETLSLRNQIASGEVTIPDDGNLAVEINFGDGTTYDKQGTVNFTDSIIDPQTGTVSARAVLANPDSRLLPGQFVRVIVKGFTKKNAIAVADQAIMQGPQGPFVYIVTPEGKAGIRPVTLGALNGKNRFIQKGLMEGDQVIIEGMIRVHPDAPVKVVDPNAQQPNGQQAPAGAPAAAKPAAAETSKPEVKAEAKPAAPAIKETPVEAKPAAPAVKETPVEAKPAPSPKAEATKPAEAPAAPKSAVPVTTTAEPVKLPEAKPAPIKTPVVKPESKAEEKPAAPKLLIAPNLMGEKLSQPAKEPVVIKETTTTETIKVTEPQDAKPKAPIKIQEPEKIETPVPANERVVKEINTKTIVEETTTKTSETKPAEKPDNDDNVSSFPSVIEE